MADRKITDLTALAAGSQATGDLLTIVDVSEAAATDKNKKITVESLFKGIPGDVGIGTSSPNGRIAVAESVAGRGIEILSSDANGAGFIGTTNESGSSNGIQINSNRGSGKIVLKTNATERLRIDSSGRLLLGTTTEGNVDADDLTVAGSGNTGITIRSGTSSLGSIYFSDGTSGSAEYDGWIDYSQSSRFLRFGTAAAERMRIDSSGRVGIGTSSPASGKKLHVVGKVLVEDSFPEVFVKSSGTTMGGVRADTTNKLELKTITTAPLSFQINSSEKARIDTSGRLLVGTSSSSLPTGVQIQGYADAATYQGILTISRGSSVTIADRELGEIRFHDNGNGYGAKISALTDATWATNDYPTRLVFSTTADGASSPSERMRIDRNGNVGIANSSPSYLLDVKQTSAGTVAAFTGSTDGGRPLKFTSADNGIFLGAQWTRDVASSGGIHAWAVDGSEKARIDSSGRLLVGTSSSPAGVGGYGRLSPLVVQGYTGGSGAGGYMSLQRGETASGISSGDEIGILNFNESDGFTFAQIRCFADGAAGSSDYPGRLSFYTTADGASGPTERMRITSGGFLKASNTGSYVSSTSSQHEFRSNVNSAVLKVTNNNSSFSGAILVSELTNSAPNNTSARFLYCGDTSAERCTIRSNGGIANFQSNNANLCDEREKKNIVSLDTKWDKVKNWELKKFHYNEDADTDDLRYGVIAQQVEEHCPEVITDWTKRGAQDAVLDDDGNVVTPAVAEIVRKGVKEQQMMWMAIKALQEAQARIETLESQQADLLARVTALEAG